MNWLHVSLNSLENVIPENHFNAELVFDKVADG